jgi:hypothetical protein
MASESPSDSLHCAPMKAYIIAATLGEYQDALRQLGLHERAAVHIMTPGNLQIPRDGPIYVYRNGAVLPLWGTRRFALPRRAA